MNTTCPNPDTWPEADGAWPASLRNRRRRPLIASEHLRALKSRYSHEHIATPVPLPPPPMAGFPQNILSAVFLTLLGIMSAALAVTIYHWVVFGLCCQGLRGGAPSGAPRSDAAAAAGGEEAASPSACLVPPECTYGKGEGMVGGGESTCPVCLCDFKDGEQVRLLPECMHYYHVSCIDMWLQSHNSCPMCRTETTPPAVSRPVSGWHAPAGYSRMPG
ncbi:hypothetical protein Taro_037494 [Colocasia esculenta]|uniref:RING-type domain-containing protein n=1 Tax=Colocasia esculenta TaxID=4460 RepID=A0A843W5T6_COLES|nr:hypothetical protein [Colocasia esculenta]